MENEQNIPEQKMDDVIEEQPYDNLRHGHGIIGSSTNHDAIMTRIWADDKTIRKIEIHVSGSEFTKQNAQRIAKQIQGKNLQDVELLLNYKDDPDRRELPQMDTIYESIMRALYELHHPSVEQSVEELPQEPDSILSVDNQHDTAESEKQSETKLHSAIEPPESTNP